MSKPQKDGESGLLNRYLVGAMQFINKLLLGKSYSDLQ